MGFTKRTNLKRFINATFLFFLTVGLLFSCSLRKIVSVQLQPVVEEVQKSILEEKYEKLSQESLPFAIKFAEGIYRYYPKSPYYSAKLGLLYGAYGFAYLDEGPYSDFDLDSEVKIALLQDFYRKSFDFGLQSLEIRLPGFSTSYMQTDTLLEILQKAKPRDVEPLFWFSFSWALSILNDLSDVENLVRLENVKIIADRIIELDPSYFYGAPYTILAAYYGARTASIGGDLRQSLKMYEKAKEFANDKSLIPDYVMMRFVATQSMDSRDFDAYYEQIKSFDINKNPSFAYINVFLKRKAEELFKKKSDIF